MANAKQKRDYEKESNWATQKYKRFEIKVDKDYGEELKGFLVEENLSFADWVRKSYEQQKRERIKK